MMQPQPDMEQPQGLLTGFLKRILFRQATRSARLWVMLAATYDPFRIVPRGIVPIACYGEHLEVFLTTNYLAVRRPD